jgi:hypothetical protein
MAMDAVSPVAAFKARQDKAQIAFAGRAALGISWRTFPETRVQPTRGPKNAMVESFLHLRGLSLRL